jgi:hypothetical protein
MEEWFNFLSLSVKLSLFLTLFLYRKEMEEWLSLLFLSIKLSPYFFSLSFCRKKMEEWFFLSSFTQTIFFFLLNYLFFLFLSLVFVQKKGKMSCSSIFEFLFLSQSCRIVECNLWITQNCILSISVILVLSFSLSFFFLSRKELEKCLVVSPTFFLYHNLAKCSSLSFFVVV